MLSPKIHLQQRPESSRFGKPHADLLARTMHGKDRSLTLGFDGNGLLGICHHPDRPRICRIVLVTDVEGLNELCGHQFDSVPHLGQRAGQALGSRELPSRLETRCANARDTPTA